MASLGRVGDQMSSGSSGVTPRASMPYVPGIDGLRALALVTIVVFHLGYSWLPGGVFSVTLFFTVSGYLITSLALAESSLTHTIDLRRFWARRFRRLMPAALAVLTLIAIGGAVGVFEGERLRGDIMWAAGYLSNWRSASAPTTYADLFAGESSPVIHFWTLAIEEQFYIVFPPVMWALLRVRRLMVPAFVLMTVASVVLMVSTSSQNVAYYATTSRAAELLIGVLFAFVFPVQRTWGPVASRLWAGGGVIGLVVYIVLSLTVHTGDGAVYNGALPLFAVVSTLMIASVVVRGPMRSLFAWRPLVETGKLSYSLYLLHWPVIIALNESRVGVGGLALNVVRVVVTAVSAYVLTRFIETPIRQRRVIPKAGQAVVVAFASVVIMVGFAAMVPSEPPRALAGVDAPDQFVDFGDTPDASTAPSAPAEPDLRVRVVGGVGSVVDQLAAAAPDGATVEIDDLTNFGCAIRPYAGRVGGCESLMQQLGTGDPADSPADVVVLVFGDAERDLLTRLIGDAAAHSSLEHETPLHREMRVRAEYVEAIQAVMGDRPFVIWDTHDKDALRDDLSDLAQRVDRVEALIQPTGDDVARAVSVWLAMRDGADQRTRVMVIGDSNSFAVAQGIDQAAGERYDTLWAGGRNCPIVPLQRLRWWEGAEFDLTACPTVDDWAKAVADFVPDAILIVVTGPEQSEQMYDDTVDPDGGWHVIGDPVFDDLHRAEMARLMEVAVASGARVVFFNSPGVYSGAFKDAQFSDPARIEAWNAMIAGFATTWPQIGVIDWASILAAAETAGGGEPGSLRGDGIHMEAADMRRLMGDGVLPALEQILGATTSG